LFLAGQLLQRQIELQNQIQQNKKGCLKYYFRDSLITIKKRLKG